MNLCKQPIHDHFPFFNEWPQRFVLVLQYPCHDFSIIFFIWSLTVICLSMPTHCLFNILLCKLLTGFFFICFVSFLSIVLFIMMKFNLCTYYKILFKQKTWKLCAYITRFYSTREHANCLCFSLPPIWRNRETAKVWLKCGLIFKFQFLHNSSCTYLFLSLCP